MKLNDTQLILLSSASRRGDGLVVMPANLKDDAPKVVKPLLTGGLLKAIKAMEQGATPPGVDPAHQRVRSAAVLLPHDQPFSDGAKEALAVREGIAHATV